MCYDVLINYTNNFDIHSCWSASTLDTYSKVVSLYKKEINSPFCFVFVRKRFLDKQSSIICTNFRLITKTSYTFSHFPKLTDYKNSYFAKRFTQIITDKEEFNCADKS